MYTSLAVYHQMAYRRYGRVDARRLRVRTNLFPTGYDETASHEMRTYQHVLMSFCLRLTGIRCQYRRQYIRM